jgi:hypothetical protein
MRRGSLIVVTADAGLDLLRLASLNWSRQPLTNGQSKSSLDPLFHT